MTARAPGPSDGIKRAVCLACGSEMISIETDGTRDELVAALRTLVGIEKACAPGSVLWEASVDDARAVLAKVQS